MIWQDPIVTQVRQARQAHAAQLAFDPKAIYMALKEQEKASDRPKDSFPPRRTALPVDEQTSVTAKSQTVA